MLKIEKAIVVSDYRFPRGRQARQEPITADQRGERHEESQISELGAYMYSSVAYANYTTPPHP